MPALRRYRQGPKTQEASLLLIQLQTQDGNVQRLTWMAQFRCQPECQAEQPLAQLSVAWASRDGTQQLRAFPAYPRYSGGDMGVSCGIWRELSIFVGWETGLL